MPALTQAAMEDESWLEHQQNGLYTAALIVYILGGILLATVVFKHRNAFSKPRMMIFTLASFFFFLPAVTLAHRIRSLELCTGAWIPVSAHGVHRFESHRQSDQIHAGFHSQFYWWRIYPPSSGGKSGTFCVWYLTDLDPFHTRRQNLAHE